MQAFFCKSCFAAYTAELRGHSCPACGDELVHGRVPSGAKFSFRKSKSPGVGRAIWDHIIKKDICAYCAADRSTTVDHIVPKALGGSKGSWTNRIGACFQCNQEKAHIPLLFFMLERLGNDLAWMKTDDGSWPIPKALSTQEAQDVLESDRFNPFMHKHE